MILRYTRTPMLLQQGMQKTSRTQAGLAQELGYRSPGIVRLWLEGRDLPVLDRHRRIAELLQLDVRQLTLAWVIDAAPVLAEPMGSLLRIAELDLPLAHGDDPEPS